MQQSSGQAASETPTASLDAQPLSLVTLALQEQEYRFSEIICNKQWSDNLQEPTSSVHGRLY